MDFCQQQAPTVERILLDVIQYPLSEFQEEKFVLGCHDRIEMILREFAREQEVLRMQEALRLVTALRQREVLPFEE